MSLSSFLFTYILGGLTFIPIILIISYVLLDFYVPKQDPTEELTPKSELDEFSVMHPEIQYDELNSGEFEERTNCGVETYLTGWLTVTTEFYQLSQYQGPRESVATNDGDTDDDAKLDDKKTQRNQRYSQIYKFVKGDKNGGKEASDDTGGVSMKSVRKKNRYFAVLRHGNLFLYKDDDCKNVQHVIVLKNSIISIWPRTLKEGELFSKRSAICILKKELSRDNPSKRPATLDLLQNKSDQDTPPKDSFYIYSDYNHEKEDWYFNLIRATKRPYLRKDNDEDKLEPQIYAKTAFFKTKNMINLIQDLNSSEGQLTTKWLNALIGRLFLGLHNTKEFHDFVKARVEKKLMKIKKPGFLDDFQIQKINVGNGAPLFTFPRLVNLSPEGELDVELNVLYKGGLSIEISTKANINLGSHFKTKEVSLVLTVTLQRLSGKLLVKMKPPPSNRIWYGFTSMPDIDLDVEPVVSARQLTYGVVTKMIVNKFKELIKESLVVPYMDEFPIYNTQDEIFRGGIWDKTVRLPRKRKRPPTMDENDYDSESGVEEYKSSAKTGSFSSNHSMRSRKSHDSISLLSSMSHPEVVPTEEIPAVVDQEVPVQEEPRPNVYTDKTADVEYLIDDDSVMSQHTDTSRELFPDTKQNISSSMKKLNKWYNTKVKELRVDTVPDELSQREPKTPEMIKHRRDKSVVSQPVVQPQQPVSSAAMFRKDIPSTSSRKPPSLPPRDNMAIPDVRESLGELPRLPSRRNSKVELLVPGMSRSSSVSVPVLDSSNGSIREDKSINDNPFSN